jgi:glutaredoxin
VLELYQAEWCPHSAKVRRRLTDLQIDFVARQVPAEQEDRDELEAATGCREIPTLVTDDGKVYSGEDEILQQLTARIGSWARPTGSTSRRTTRPTG